MNTTTLTRGWGWPFNAKMEHYFADGHSLCGYWDAGSTTITREHVPGPRPCTLCTEKLENLR